MNVNSVSENTNQICQNTHVTKAIYYGSGSILALATLGFSYYAHICNSESGFFEACGTPLVSLKFNLGLPLVSLSLGVKAYQAYKIALVQTQPADKSN